MTGIRWRNCGEVCLWLTEEVNTWSAQVPRGQDGQMELKGSPEKKAVEAMEGLGEIYPQLGGILSRAQGASQSLDPVGAEADRSVFALYHRGQL